MKADRKLLAEARDLLLLLQPSIQWQITPPADAAERIGALAEKISKRLEG